MQLNNILCKSLTQKINTYIFILLAVVLIIMFIIFTTTGPFKELNDIIPDLSYSKTNNNNNETKHIIFNSNDNGFLKVPGYGQISNYNFPNASRGPSNDKCDAINYFNSNKNKINKASNEFNTNSIIIIVIYVILLIISPIIFGYNSIYCQSPWIPKTNVTTVFIISWIVILILVIFISVQLNSVNTQQEDLNNKNINDIFGNNNNNLNCN